MKALAQTSKFIQEVRVELSRVEWPKPEEFIGATLITLMLVLFFTIFFFLVDGIIKVVLHQVL